MSLFYEKLIGRFSGGHGDDVVSKMLFTEKSKSKSYTFNPFITVSREPGSGGRPAAKKLANLLKFEFCDRALLERVAKSAKKRKALIESIDERGRSKMEDFTHSLLNPDYMSDTLYIKHLCNVVLTLAEKGDCVILGRGANFYTSHERGLHVRIAAPFSYRVEMAIKYEKLPERRAKSRVEKVDLDRKTFVKQYFNRDISDGNYYDLILNSTYFKPDDMAKLIIRVFEHKFPGYLKQFKIRQRRIAAKKKK